MNHLIRAAGLSGYEALAQAQGLDAARLLRRFGLSREVLDDPDHLIPYRAMIELLEHSAAASACPDFGLRLASSQGPEKFGPLAVVMEHAANLQEAIQLATRYVFVHSSAARLKVEAVPGQPDQLDLCYHFDLPDPPASAQAVELALGVIVRCLRLLSQSAIPLIAVLMPHPRQGSPAQYAQSLGTACLFEQNRAAVRLNAHMLEQALPKRNDLLRKLAQAYLDQQFSQPELAFSDRVRALMRQLLATGQASHEQVSKMLSVHPRTMQRRLSAEGTSFEQLKDQERRALFEQLITHPHGPSVSALADLLGYAAPSALTRSAQRWFGLSPTQLRRQHARASGLSRTVAK
ncbi:AraC family transcriptional regulator [Roseateles koreensis]|uniref:AraC family transcriptional regulator ligand-binding domain-containing protein n=1 Tax=Roseateles koreensis TaxID=2987526 RepID=A0ABT5KT91_9BURK|nr:AraC family transcriptional regulator [Roseateles koreensis]MDC8785660.1 AraC family transcriptional regulator ligand-binding domain-containing protein [Roseateles koreensis]